MFFFSSWPGQRGFLIAPVVVPFFGFKYLGSQKGLGLLKGSGDLASRVLSKVSIGIPT